MDTTAVRRARRWFWTLTATAVLAMGALSHGLRSAPGPTTGILVLGSSLALAASALQTARILAVLVGPPCLPLPGPRARRRSAAGGHQRLSSRR
ncbi:hypothetical protein [Streptomyces sp. NBC_01481]|uniref:hypothetical protein n=1 Tax=Streptomyces sp. NBC_01481 TaxID=2975869 RepID=UPI002258F490|nr:hypothetical protein [Streptomyces sp. NBC_01481]MCX4584097.1 hypothetical protein [Streptomyces sp. NBC_01481]